MKTYTFHTGDYSPIASYLFNQPKHTQLQSEKVRKCFYVLDNYQNCTCFIWFFIDNQKALSPLKAPFASVEIIEPISNKILYSFITYCLDELVKLGVKRVSIKNPPTIYDETKSATLNVMLQNLGFQLAVAEISSIIQVSKDDYITRLTSWEIRKLKQSKAAGLTLKMNPLSDLETVYGFIKRCREKKEFELSMSIEQLIAMHVLFPNEIILFTIVKEHEIVAACISILVRKDILYTFYYDHDSNYNLFSPVVLLMDGIYEHCFKNSVSLIDLGTAALNGQPNFNLLDFKQNLGGKPSAKYTFEKELV